MLPIEYYVAISIRRQSENENGPSDNTGRPEVDAARYFQALGELVEKISARSAPFGARLSAAVPS